MGSWCADNLRGVQAWRDEGLPLTVSSDEAAKLFDAVVRQVVSWIDCAQLGGITQCMQAMMAAEPDFLMGRVLVAGLDAMGTGRSVHVDKLFRKELDAIVEDSQKGDKYTDRERKHALAVNYFATGEMLSACIVWETILAEHPTDLLAVKFAHDAYFFRGDCTGKRDSVERVLPKWRSHYPCQSYLHGMYAFGLEECGQYKESEENARLALSLNRQDCWATHAIAHCLEMSSNYKEGIHFMEGTVQDWEPCHMLATHNWWHTTLFYIEKGDTEAALSLYDREISTRSKMHGAMLDIVDAASMLTRLEMERVKVGRERWEELRALVEPHIDDHTLTFNDAHISMVLSRLGDEEVGEGDSAHRRSISSFIHNGSGGDNARLTRDLGSIICDAISDFNHSRYEGAFSRLYPIRFQVFRIGGSHAQRDVFTQMLIHSGLRSPNAHQRAQALEVIEERERIKPGSPLAARILAKHKEGEDHNHNHNYTHN